MKSITIEMPYIKDLSVNHYLGRRRGGGYYVKKEVKAWGEELGWLIKTQHIEDWKLPLHVNIDCVFRNKRDACDPHNLLKVVCDAIEEVTGVNDKYYTTSTGEPLFDAEQEPHLIISIGEDPTEVN